MLVVVGAQGFDLPDNTPPTSSNNDIKNQSQKPIPSFLDVDAILRIIQADADERDLFAPIPFRLDPRIYALWDSASSSYVLHIGTPPESSKPQTNEKSSTTRTDAFIPSAERRVFSQQVDDADEQEVTFVEDTTTTAPREHKVSLEDDPSPNSINANSEYERDD